MNQVEKMPKMVVNYNEMKTCFDSWQMIGIQALISIVAATLPFIAYVLPDFQNFIQSPSILDIVLTILFFILGPAAIIMNLLIIAEWIMLGIVRIIIYIKKYEEWV